MIQIDIILKDVSIKLFIKDAIVSVLKDSNVRFEPVKFSNVFLSISICVCVAQNSAHEVHRVAE